MPDDATTNVLLYFSAIMVIIGNCWNVFQIYERLTRRCKKDEDVTQNGCHETQHQQMLYQIQEMHDVIIREDESGRKLVYTPKEFLRRLAQRIELSTAETIHSAASRSHHSHSRTDSSEDLSD
jgi:ABC-type nickel/cobalt efflux system permease component RcnA